jgi:hypothetical protein
MRRHVRRPCPPLVEEELEGFIMRASSPSIVSRSLAAAGGRRAYAYETSLRAFEMPTHSVSGGVLCVVWSARAQLAVRRETRSLSE